MIQLLNEKWLRGHRYVESALRREGCDPVPAGPWGGERPQISPQKRWTRTRAGQGAVATWYDTQPGHDVHSTLAARGLSSPDAYEGTERSRPHPYALRRCQKLSPPFPPPTSVGYSGLSSILFPTTTTRSPIPEAWLWIDGWRPPQPRAWGAVGRCWGRTW